jgi:hypothetical protein
MAPPKHAGFAAAGVVSESLVNVCLNAYLTTYADGQHAQDQWSAPIVVNGTPVTLRGSVDYALLSVKARLIANPQNRASLVFRFYGRVNLDVLRGSVVDTSYSPEVMIDASVSTALVALVVKDQFQFGFDLRSSALSSVSVQILALGLPPSIQSQIANLLQSSATVQTLDGLLHRVLPQILPATTTMVPAFYDFSAQQPLRPAARWFGARIAATNLVWKVLDDCVVAAVDVPGHSSGSAADLGDFRGPRTYWDTEEHWPLGVPDAATAVNLEFVERFLNREIFRNMAKVAVARGLDLNRVRRFQFMDIPTQTDPARPGFEVELDITYWTDEVLDFFLRGTTAVNVTATIRGYPYMRGTLLGVEITHVDVDLPAWVDIIGAITAIALPPLTLLLPFIFQDLLANAMADVINRLNRRASASALALDRELTLPATAGPRFRVKPRVFSFWTRPGDKSMAIYLDLSTARGPEFEVSLEARTVTIPDYGWLSYEIRKDGGLPQYVRAALTVPPGLFQPHDPTLRVRYQTFHNGQPVPAYTRDVPYGDVRARSVALDTTKFTNPNKVDQDVKITCRFYRTLGPATEELLNRSVDILAVDPRPDTLKPYVQWSHYVRYWNGHKLVERRRLSKIHKAPGRGGCKFSNGYLLPSMHAAFKFFSSRHFTELPFDVRFLEAHRDLLCPYCFFGGPDKHAPDPLLTGVDLTGVRRRIDRRLRARR